MSAHDRSPTATPIAGTARPVGRRRWILTIGLVVAVVALGALLWPNWRRHELITQIPANLPARPDAPKPPALLTERLAKAERQARTPATALQGMAELGRLYHASGYTHEAEACWQLLRAAQPREARWSYFLADLRQSVSDNAGMTELLEATTRLAPEYAPAWLRLADLQLKTGELASAERSYRKRLALVPGDRYANLGLVRVALQQGRTDQARELVEALVKAAPEFSPGHNLIAEMLAARGETDAAAKHRWLGRETGRFRPADDPWLDELVGWCFNYEQLCMRGTMDFQTKYADHGKSCFERAIQLQPETLTAYTLLGSLYLEENDPAQARDVFERGLAQTKGVPSALFYVHLSRAYREMKQPAEAVRVAREGLARTGEEFELYDALGVALGDLGQPEAAVDALRTAVARNPTDTSSNYNLAVALISVGRLDEAIEALHRSLTLRPTFPSSLALLAQVEIDSGRWQSAAQYLHPLYESHPEMPQARRMMAYWHLRSGTEAEQRHDSATAEHHYRAGVAIDRNHAELQMRLGTLCLMANRFADAVEPLEAYHRLQPADPQSYLFLGQAYAAVRRYADARQILVKGVQAAERTGNTSTAQYCREILQQLP